MNNEEISAITIESIGKPLYNKFLENGDINTSKMSNLEYACFMAVKYREEAHTNSTQDVENIKKATAEMCYEWFREELLNFSTTTGDLRVKRFWNRFMGNFKQTKSKEQNDQ